MFKPRGDAIQLKHLGELLSALDAGDGGYSWVCRDCLGLVVREAVENLDMQAVEADVSEVDDSYWDPEVFRDM